MVVDLLVGCRHAKLIDPQGKPFRAYPSVPALCGGRFDRDTVLDLRRENLLPVTQILLTEKLHARQDRKSTRLNSSHVAISYAVFCLKKKKKRTRSDIINMRRADTCYARRYAT